MVTAITGTIGSGKSAVGDVLRAQGKTVIDCDRINADLLTDKYYLSKLEKEFPYAFDDGIFNKKELAKRVFADDKERMKLNSISHPIILSELKEIIAQKDGDVFVEIPLLKEEFLQLFDRIVYVICDREIKLARICKRNSISREEAIKRLDSQREIKFNELPAIYIINNSDLESLDKEVKARLL